MADFKAFSPTAWKAFTKKCSELFPFLKKTFVGTRAEWDALQVAEKTKYDLADFTNDVAEGGAVVVDEVTSGNLNPVTSNAVYGAIANKISVSKGSGSSLSDAFDAAGISKSDIDIYGVCNHIAVDLIKGSGATANTVTLHNYAAGGPAYAIILQKLSTDYGAALIFSYADAQKFLFRLTNGSIYHIERYY